jgi:hypothetical protein
MTYVAEALHEIGRKGVLEAKSVLEGLLPDAVDLPFNAYDTSHHLTFDDQPNFGGKGDRFVLDLGGVLKRNAPQKAAGIEATSIFVEVKTKEDGSGILEEYREFLRRAAVVSLQPSCKDAWFVFYCTVPFGSSKGSELVDGTLLRQCAEGWPQSLKAVAVDLEGRVVLVIATKSFVRLLTSWYQRAR